MNSFKLLTLLIKMGLPINQFGHLLSMKVELTGPDSIIYVMAVSGCRLNYQGNLINLYMATDETLALVPIRDGAETRWEFRIPNQFNPIEIMQISFYSL